MKHPFFAKNACLASQLTIPLNRSFIAVLALVLANVLSMICARTHAQTQAQDTPPPIPDRYQVIDLSPYTAIDMNDNGDVLLGDLFFDVNRSDNPGTRLTNATYYVWRDANRDAEIDPVELQQVCSYQFAFTGSVKPEFSPFTYYSSSSAGCSPVAINNAGQVLAGEGAATSEPFNCSTTQCQLMTTGRSKALLWQDGNSTFIDGLVGLFDNGLGQSFNFLRLTSLDNLGRFAAEGQLTNSSSLDNIVAFIYDGTQRLLPTIPNVSRYLPIINDLGQVAFRVPRVLIEADGTERPIPGAQLLDLNNRGDVLTITANFSSFQLIRDDGSTVVADLPQGFDPLSGVVNDQRQLAITTVSIGPTITHAMVQDNNNDGMLTADEFVDLRDRVGDQLPPEEISQVIDLNNRGQLLIRGQAPQDIPEGTSVRTTATDYLLKPEKPWLVMVALAYDDTTSLSAMAIQERLDAQLNDLEAAAQNEQVQIVAMVDTPSLGDSAYYVIKPDDDDQLLGEYEVGVDLIELGELDITDPGALIQFVDWARKNFPASREILMLDGAAGPGGLMPDDTSTNAFGFMTMNQLQVVLSEIGSDRRLDLLVLNNPHLAMLEVGFAVREGARYMIASQTRIRISQGSYRRMIERLPEPAARAETLAVVQNLTQALGISRIYETATGPVPVATSVVDLDEIEAPLDLANLMALALNANLPLYAPHMQATLKDVQYFDTNDDLEQNTDDNLLDLVSFYIVLTNKLIEAGFDEDTDPLLSADLINAFDRTVLDYVVDHVKTNNGSVLFGDVGRSSGVSIFFPSKASHFYDGANYSYASGAIWNSGPSSRQGPSQAPAWGQLLVDYFALTDPGGAIDSALPQPRSPDPLPAGATQRTIFYSGFE